MSTISKSADLLDLVFRGRNKAYGAYDLRRVYPTHIKRSMIIFLLLVIAIAGGYSLYNYLKENVKFETEKPVRAVTELKAPPPLEDKKNPPPPPPPPPPPIKATIQFVPPKVVEIARPEEEIKTVEEVVESKAQVASETVVGQELPEEIELGNGNGPVEAPKSNEPFAFVEQMPEFPGGEDALIRYLQKNIRYPNYAAENEIEGTVQVEFIVNEDGSIQNTKVVKGIKGGCDEEALRVVKSMPKWKPGKQGGHAVRVYYTVPVTFRLE